MNDGDLTAEEWEKMRQLSLGPLRLPLGEETRRKLVEIGYAADTGRGIELTPLGAAAVERHFARQD